MDRNPEVMDLLEVARDRAYINLDVATTPEDVADAVKTAKEVIYTENEFYKTTFEQQKIELDEKKLEFEKEKLAFEKDRQKAQDEATAKQNKSDKWFKVGEIVLRTLGILIPAGILGYNTWKTHDQEVKAIIPNPESKAASREAESWSLKKF